MEQIPARNELVPWLRRPALLVGALCAAVPALITANPAQGQTAAIEIELRNTATGADDYICWSPVEARLRVSQDGPLDGGGPITVTLRSKELAGPGTGGAVRFSPFVSAPRTPDQVTLSDTLTITVPGTGGFVPLLVAGHRASFGSKDVAIVAENASSDELGRTTAMVRVRKNALDLTPQERSAFLEAIATLNGHRNPLGPRDAFAKYARAHAQAFSYGIHGGHLGFPLFLAWHRAFLLSLERELQASHPEVALPYWAFDERSDGVFVPGFMGSVAGGVRVPGATQVNFDTANPLSGWRLPSGAARNGILIRSRNAVVPLKDFRRTTKTVDEIIGSPGGKLYSFANGDFERNFHNQAHVHVGGTLNSGASPADPLFFMLHANVDRGWAEWQGEVDRFDPADERAYSLQGVFPALPGELRKGSWSGDAMWPWSREDGGATTIDNDDWPSTGFPFPAGVGPFGPLAPPSPGDMIDYMGVRGAMPLEMCYDDLKWPA